MSYHALLFEVRDGVALITVNRPDKLNALNDEVVRELADAAERVATDAAIAGAILTGAGQKAFVAGADIADLVQQGPFDGKARALRPARGEARHRPRLRRHATAAAARGQGQRPAVDLDGRDDRRPGSTPHRAREPSGPGGGADGGGRADPARDPRHGSACSAARPGSGGPGAGDDARRGTAA